MDIVVYQLAGQLLVVLKEHLFIPIKKLFGLFQHGGSFLLYFVVFFNSGLDVFLVEQQILVNCKGGLLQLMLEVLKVFVKNSGSLANLSGDVQYLLMLFQNLVVDKGEHPKVVLIFFVEDVFSGLLVIHADDLGVICAFADLAGGVVETFLQMKEYVILQLVVFHAEVLVLFLHFENETLLFSGHQVALVLVSILELLHFGGDDRVVLKHPLFHFILHCLIFVLLLGCLLSLFLRLSMGELLLLLFGQLHHDNYYKRIRQSLYIIDFYTPAIALSFYIFRPFEAKIDVLPLPVEGKHPSQANSDCIPLHDHCVLIGFPLNHL